MTEERLTLHLNSMKKAAENAVRITSAISYDEFVATPDVQAAAAMYLIVVGEAATKIVQLASPEAGPSLSLPLEQMRGLRNRIVHEYETLHLPTIWATVKESLPALLSDLRSIG